jgi:iron(III) transport system permease protein
VGRKPLLSTIQMQTRHKEKRNFILAIAVYICIALGPTLFLLLRGFSRLRDGNWEWLRLLAPTGRRFDLLQNSFGTALSVAVVSAVLGLLAAGSLWWGREKVGSSLLWLVLPLAAIPPYVHALTWFSLITRIDGPLRSLGVSTEMLYGWLGCIWVGVATYAPLALGFAWLGLRAVDPQLIEAARTVRSDPETILHIALPLSAPAVLAGAGVIFLLHLLDYSVPSLFQINVYAIEIFAEYSASANETKALLLSVPLLVLAAGVAALLVGPLQSLVMNVVQHRARWRATPDLPVWMRTVSLGALAIVLFQALAPLAVLSLEVGTSRRILDHILQAQEAIVYSLKVAAVAALVTLPLAFPAAKTLAQVDRRWLWALVLLPVTLPAALVGVTLIPLTRIDGAVPMPASFPTAAVHVVRYLPFAVIVLASQFRRSDPGLFDAAMVFQARAWRRWALISLPLRFPGLLAASGLVFALSLGELGAALMVVPPGESTLTMRIYNYLHYGASSTVSGLSLVLTAAVALAAFAAVVAAASWISLLGGGRRMP